jgi:hypothetical protein
MPAQHKPNAGTAQAARTNIPPLKLALHSSDACETDGRFSWPPLISSAGHRRLEIGAGFLAVRESLGTSSGRHSSSATAGE